MGIFSEWQPQYQERGIATFPVSIANGDKRPSVNGYLKTGSRLSAKYAEKFSDSEAFGLAVKRNRLTVLDVDTPDERVLADALEMYGPSPFIVRSGSGNHQVWYRRNGERRAVRPVRGVPIDILGDGYVVAPPSKGVKGRYEIIEGSLDDLQNLPTMRRLDAIVPAGNVGAEPVAEGRRDATLFGHCMEQARHVETLDELIDIGRYFNETACVPPLPDAQVIERAKSAWSYEKQGKNWHGIGQRVVVTHDVVDTLAAADPFAFALLGILQRHHNGCDDFILAKGMAESIGWTLRRWYAARDALVSCDIIRCIHPGGRRPNDPPVYGWGSYGV